MTTSASARRRRRHGCCSRIICDSSNCRRSCGNMRRSPPRRRAKVRITSAILLRLVELELIDRERRMVERRIRAARFPAVKSFDTFDFTAIPSLNKPLVLELARCEYVVARDNIIALGNSGTGKTHVCSGARPRRLPTGSSPSPSRRRPALVHQLMEARDEKRLLQAPGATCRRQAADRRRTWLCAAVADRRRAAL